MFGCFTAFNIFTLVMEIGGQELIDVFSLHQKTARFWGPRQARLLSLSVPYETCLPARVNGSAAVGWVQGKRMGEWVN